METEKIKIKQLMSYIKNKEISSKVLFLGVSKKTKGGMTAVRKYLVKAVLCA